MVYILPEHILAQARDAVHNLTARGRQDSWRPAGGGRLLPSEEAERTAGSLNGRAYSDLTTERREAADTVLADTRFPLHLWDTDAAMAAYGSLPERTAETETAALLAAHRRQTGARGQPMTVDAIIARRDATYERLNGHWGRREGSRPGGSGDDFVVDPAPLAAAELALERFMNDTTERDTLLSTRSSLASSVAQAQRIRATPDSEYLERAQRSRAQMEEELRRLTDPYAPAEDIERRRESRDYWIRQLARSDADFIADLRREDAQRLEGMDRYIAETRGRVEAFDRREAARAAFTQEESLARDIAEIPARREALEAELRALTNPYETADVIASRSARRAEIMAELAQTTESRTAELQGQLDALRAQRTGPDREEFLERRDALRREVAFQRARQEEAARIFEEGIAPVRPATAGIHEALLSVSDQQMRGLFTIRVDEVRHGALRYGSIVESESATLTGARIVTLDNPDATIRLDSYDIPHRYGWETAPPARNRTSLPAIVTAHQLTFDGANAHVSRVATGLGAAFEVQDTAEEDGAAVSASRVMFEIPAAGTAIVANGGRIDMRRSKLGAGVITEDVLTGSSLQIRGAGRCDISAQSGTCLITPRAEGTVIAVSREDMAAALNAGRSPVNPVPRRTPLRDDAGAIIEDQHVDHFEMVMQLSDGSTPHQGHTLIERSGNATLEITGRHGARVSVPLMRDGQPVHTTPQQYDEALRQAMTDLAAREAEAARAGSGPQR